MSLNTPFLLIIEDSDADYEALSRAFKKTGGEIPHHRCVTGDDALKYLGHEVDPENSGRFRKPSLIILDLNLPGTDGREVLQIIKKTEMLRAIPVVAFTTSTNPVDVNRCYEIGVNGYLQKPVDFDRLMEVVRIFRSYWFETAVLPLSTN